MGKRSRRAGRAARDIHAAILKAAEGLKAAPAFGVRDADEVPELAELVDAARVAVHRSMPGAFEFEGRRYWLRVRLAVQFDIFDSPAKADPLVRGVSFSTESSGHAPGH